MIGSIFKFGEINLSKLGVIEKAEYENHSFDLITLPRTLIPDYYFSRKRKFKEVGIQFRYIHHNTKIREIENVLENIIGDLHEQEKSLLQLNNKYCEAVLNGATKEIVGNTGFLELNFISLDGQFYGEIKNEKIVSGANSTLENNGITETDNVNFLITATNSDISVKCNSNVINVKDCKIGSTIDIDLKNKTVTQGDRHLGIDLYSDFFTLKKGVNKITIKGGDTEVKYREVVAL